MFFMFAVLCYFLILSIEPAFSQWLSPPTNLKSAATHPLTSQVRYKDVPPGICEQGNNIRSISGYVDVSADEHIFFWFFETRHGDPKTAPLTTWINGGPGASSMIGLFQEMGPCSIEADGTVVNNPYSWTNNSNLLFIDQPVQTGFSYSTTTPGYISPKDGSVIPTPDGVCPSDEITNATCGTYSDPNGLLGIPVSTSAAASSFYAALTGFMQAFPQYARTKFNFATESYGGHYGPVFAEHIEAQNTKNGANTTKISLESLTIINGWMNPMIQYAAYYNFTVSPGNTYDYKPYNSYGAGQLYANVYHEGGCLDQLEKCAASETNSVCATADHYCLLAVENFFDFVTGRDEYDIRQLEPDPYPPETYIRYLNSAKVQAAIGAYVNYTDSSMAVASAFNTTGDDGRLDGTTTNVQALVEQGVSVTMIYGDADYNANWFGGEAAYNSLLTAGSPTPGYVNISTSDALVHGQAKQTGVFAFARIYDSGHEVPYYQPLAALTIFERTISGYDVATGRARVNNSGSSNGNFVTVGEAQSTYREGGGSVRVTVEQGVVATTYSSVQNTGGAGSGRGEKIQSQSLSFKPLHLSGGDLIVEDHLGASTYGAAPRAGGGDWVGEGKGLANLSLKHRLGQLVHISQRRKRRRSGRGRGRSAW